MRTLSGDQRRGGVPGAGTVVPEFRRRVGEGRATAAKSRTTRLVGASSSGVVHGDARAPSGRHRQHRRETRPGRSASKACQQRRVLRRDGPAGDRQVGAAGSAERQRDTAFRCGLTDLRRAGVSQEINARVVVRSKASIGGWRNGRLPDGRQHADRTLLDDSPGLFARPLPRHSSCRRQLLRRMEMFEHDTRLPAVTCLRTTAAASSRRG